MNEAIINEPEIIVFLVVVSIILTAHCGLRVLPGISIASLLLTHCGLDVAIVDAQGQYYHLCAGGLLV